MRQQAYALAMGKKEGAHIMGASNEADRAEKERLGDKKTAVEKQMAGARSERAERLKRSAEKKRQQQASTGPSRRGADPRDAGRSRGRSR